jgi:hypothetical protein
MLRATEFRGDSTAAATASRISRLPAQLAAAAAEVERKEAAATAVVVAGPTVIHNTTFFSNSARDIAISAIESSTIRYAQLSASWASGAGKQTFLQRRPTGFETPGSTSLVSTTHACDCPDLIDTGAQ